MTRKNIKFIEPSFLLVLYKFVYTCWINVLFPDESVTTVDMPNLYLKQSCKVLFLIDFFRNKFKQAFIKIPNALNRTAVLFDSKDG